MAAMLGGMNWQVNESRRLGKVQRDVVGNIAITLTTQRDPNPGRHRDVVGEIAR